MYMSKQTKDFSTHKHAIQIVSVNKDHKFSLNEEALSKALMQDEIKNRKVVVISVAGKTRTGKSFLLGFFLRYLQSKYGAKKNKSNWLGPEDLPLRGFSWMAGTERHTTGILMWPEIFLSEVDGEKLAIILLDTQGTFDSSSTMKDCATVFGLSIMISSVQVYNLFSNITEDDLQQLQFFTEYGCLALNETGDTPFQKLQFLVRDWNSPSDCTYGEEGGKELLNRRLQIKPNEHIELQSVRKHIKSCFKETSCFLMPHPGKKMITNTEYDGRLSGVEDDFKKHLRTFVPMLLARDKLVLKKINDSKVTAENFVQIVKSYFQVFSGKELMNVGTLCSVTAETQHKQAYEESKAKYIELMNFKNRPTQAKHNNVKGETLKLFQLKKKMGSNQLTELFMEKLEKDLDQLFQSCRSNKSTKTMLALFTQAVLISSLDVRMVTWISLIYLLDVQRICAGGASALATIGDGAVKVGERMASVGKVCVSTGNRILSELKSGMWTEHVWKPINLKPLQITEITNESNDMTVTTVDAREPYPYVNTDRIETNNSIVNNNFPFPNEDMENNATGRSKTDLNLRGRIEEIELDDENKNISKKERSIIYGMLCILLLLLLVLYGIYGINVPGILILAIICVMIGYQVNVSSKLFTTDYSAK